MNTSRAFAWLCGGIVVLVGAAVVLQALAVGWTLFAACPNRDVLSWDANLRYLTVLDMLRDLGDGRWLSVLAPVFDSPTWPALRPVLAFVLFLVAPGGPDPVLDVAFTYVTFALLFVSMAALAWRAAGAGVVRGAAVWLFAALSLLFVEEIFAYALSAMLEVQGMFFAVWTAFFLLRLYDERGDRFTVIGLFAAIQGLYHTKYPYGVMLLVALVVLEGALLLARRDPAVFALPGRILFAGRGGKVRLAGLVLFAFVALLGLGGAGLLPPAWRPSPRGMRNLFYLATLLVFIDFNLALYRSREVLRTALPRRTRVLYWMGLFPAVAWMLIHPDRFSATLGTQAHVQEAGRSFFVSLFTDVFAFAAVPGVLTVGALVFAGLAWFARRRAGAGGPQPLLVLLALWLLQLAVLEFITPNKQLRHVYHLLPAALVLSAAGTLRLIDFFPWGAESQLRPGGFVRGILPGLVLAGLALGLNAGGLRPMLTERSLGSRPVCFTGTDADRVQVARDFAASLDPARDYLEVNLFHVLVGPDGSWPEGRHIATDLDLLLRTRMAAGPGDLWLDPARPPEGWRQADRLVLLADSCDHPDYDALVRERARQHGVGLERLRALQGERPVCMIEYEIRE